VPVPVPVHHGTSRRRLLVGAELGSQILADPEDHHETVPAEYAHLA
jgi:hypothetical protein